MAFIFPLMILLLFTNSDSLVAGKIKIPANAMRVEIQTPLILGKNTSRITSGRREMYRGSIKEAIKELLYGIYGGGGGGLTLENR